MNFALATLDISLLTFLLCDTKKFFEFYFCLLKKKKISYVSKNVKKQLVRVTLKSCKIDIVICDNNYQFPHFLSISNFLDKVKKKNCVVKPTKYFFDFKHKKKICPEIFKMCFGNSFKIHFKWQQLIKHTNQKIGNFFLKVLLQFNLCLSFHSRPKENPNGRTISQRYMVSSDIEILLLDWNFLYSIFFFFLKEYNHFLHEWCTIDSCEDEFDLQILLEFK